MSESKEEPCPHCGSDLRLPPECTLEVWEQLHEERDDARTERDRAREEIARLKEQYEWQTRNADNCRADASRMGDKALKVEAERDQACAERDACVAALGYYADEKVWSFTWHESVSGEDGECADKIEFEDVETHDDETTPWIAGKRARAALARLPRAVERARLMAESARLYAEYCKLDDQPASQEQSKLWGEFADSLRRLAALDAHDKQGAGGG